jgi:hypothetical protein
LGKVELGKAELGMYWQCVEEDLVAAIME